MPSVRMCFTCRRQRQKCKPVERVWENFVGGQQDKCENCIKYGRECGPHEYTAHHERRVSNGQRSQAGRVDGTPSAAGIAPVLSQIPTRATEGIEDDRKELKRRLQSLEVHLEVTQRLHNTVNFVEQTEPQNEILYAEVFQSWNAHIKILCSMPAYAEAFAERLESYGETEAAESAYIRILSAYRASLTFVPHKPWHEIKSLLLKMARMYKGMGDFRRAAKCIWEALEAREILEAGPADLDLLKDLGETLLPQACRDLSAILRDNGSGLTFPPLQTMMESSYASNVIGSPFQSGHFTEECFEADKPVVGGIPAILNLLDVFPVADLMASDPSGRSPLYLAASLKMEGLGRAILLKAAQNPTLPQRILVNSRAPSGQTVLGAAICSHCSPSFAKLLIDNEAEIDPVPLMPVFTPLQAAIYLRMLDLVKLLLENQARVDRAYIGWQTPLELANGIAIGFPEHSVECQIAKLLKKAAREGLNSNPATVWRPP